MRLLALETFALGLALGLGLGCTSGVETPVGTVLATYKPSPTDVPAEVYRQGARSMREQTLVVDPERGAAIHVVFETARLSPTADPYVVSAEARVHTNRKVEIGAEFLSQLNMAPPLSTNCVALSVRHQRFGMPVWSSEASRTSTSFNVCADGKVVPH